MPVTHSFPVSSRWSGSTLAQPDYKRDGAAYSPGKAPIDTSAAPGYSGNEHRWNPEDLLAASLSTCHMLTFLALSKKAGLDVRSYDDNATATLEMVDKVMAVSTVALNATITVAVGSDEGKVRELFEKAHKYCFVANSVRCKVVLNASVVFA